MKDHYFDFEVYVPLNARYESYVEINNQIIKLLKANDSAIIFLIKLNDFLLDYSTSTTSNPFGIEYLNSLLNNTTLLIELLLELGDQNPDIKQKCDQVITLFKMYIFCRIVGVIIVGILCIIT